MRASKPAAAHSSGDADRTGMDSKKKSVRGRGDKVPNNGEAPRGHPHNPVSVPELPYAVADRDGFEADGNEAALHVLELVARAEAEAEELVAAARVESEAAVARSVELVARAEAEAEELVAAARVESEAAAAMAVDLIGRAEDEADEIRMEARSGLSAERDAGPAEYAQIAVERDVLAKEREALVAERTLLQRRCAEVERQTAIALERARGEVERILREAAEQAAHMLTPGEASNSDDPASVTTSREGIDPTRPGA